MNHHTKEKYLKFDIVIVIGQYIYVLFSSTFSCSEEQTIL